MQSEIIVTAAIVALGAGVDAWMNGASDRTAIGAGMAALFAFLRTRTVGPVTARHRP